MDYLLNIKGNWKHTALERLIKKNDTSQDLSRSAVFARAVRAAEGIKDWQVVQKSLSELKQEEDAPVCTSLQARYDDATASLLEQIRKDIRAQLDLQNLQAQYLVQLLQANYLRRVMQEKLTLQAEDMADESNMDLPEMAKIFTKMMLTDKDSAELRQIRKLLADWRGNRQ